MLSLVTNDQQPLASSPVASAAILRKLNNTAGATGPVLEDGVPIYVHAATTQSPPGFGHMDMLPHLAALFFLAFGEGVPLSNCPVCVFLDLMHNALAIPTAALAIWPEGESGPKALWVMTGQMAPAESLPRLLMPCWNCIYSASFIDEENKALGGETTFPCVRWEMVSNKLLQDVSVLDRSSKCHSARLTKSWHWEEMSWTCHRGGDWIPISRLAWCPWHTHDVPISSNPQFWLACYSWAERKVCGRHKTLGKDMRLTYKTSSCPQGCPSPSLDFSSPSLHLNSNSG